MGNGSKFLAFVFSYGLIWGSYELYYNMRLEEAFSLAAIGHGTLSVAFVVVATLIAKAAIAE